MPVVGQPIKLVVRYALWHRKPGSSPFTATHKAQPLAFASLAEARQWAGKHGYGGITVMGTTP